MHKQIIGGLAALVMTAMLARAQSYAFDDGLAGSFKARHYQQR